MKTITVNTPQGIGDLIWIYRKLSLVYDIINITILIIQENKVQKRSYDFLKTLDKIGIVNFKIVSCREYNKVAKSMYTVDDILCDYSVNAWLENGVHIDKIDKYPINWNINLKLGLSVVNYNYVLLYVSGCSHNSPYYQMSPENWSQLIVSVCNFIGTKNCIMIGAPYDNKKLSEIYKMAKSSLDIELFTDLHIKETMRIISNAEYFVSYQSGLSIIAEELRTPTLMVYYPENKKMVDTWVRNENISKGLIKSVFFGNSVNSIVGSSKDHIKQLGMTSGY